MKNMSKLLFTAFFAISMAIGIFGISPNEAKAIPVVDPPQWCLDAINNYPECGYYWDAEATCCFARTPTAKIPYCTGICI